MLVATFLLNGGLNQVIFLLLFLLFSSVYLWGAQIFLGRCHWVFLLFCSGWFLCWCILVPPCVHILNYIGLYCLHTSFSEQAKRTLFNLPTQEETSSKSENEIRRKKKSFKPQCTKPQCTKRQCTKTSWRGRTKMSGRNRPIEAKNVSRSIY